METMPLEQLENELERGLKTFRAFEHALDVIRQMKAIREQRSQADRQLAQAKQAAEEATQASGQAVRRADEMRVAAEKRAAEAESRASIKAESLIKTATEQAEALTRSGQARLGEIQQAILHAEHTLSQLADKIALREADLARVESAVTALRAKFSELAAI